MTRFFQPDLERNSRRAVRAKRWRCRAATWTLSRRRPYNHHRGVEHLSAQPGQRRRVRLVALHPQVTRVMFSSWFFPRGLDWRAAWSRLAPCRPRSRRSTASRRAWRTRPAPTRTRCSTGCARRVVLAPRPASRAAADTRAGAPARPSPRRYCLHRELDAMMVALELHDADVPLEALECARRAEAPLASSCGHTRARRSPEQRHAPAPADARARPPVLARAPLALPCPRRTRPPRACGPFAAGASTRASTRSGCTCPPTAPRRAVSCPRLVARWRRWLR